MRTISKIRSIFHRALRYLSFKKIKNQKKSKKNIQKERTRKQNNSQLHVNSRNKIILGMINKERRRRHLKPLVYDPYFERHAVSWSRHMAREKKLSHSGSILENCCMVPAQGSPNQITREMFYCWKKSTFHWNWMMHSEITKAGFGYSRNGKYAYGAFAFNNPI